MASTQVVAVRHHGMTVTCWPLRPAPALSERFHIALHRRSSRLLAVEEPHELELGRWHPELGIEQACDTSARGKNRPAEDLDQRQAKALTAGPGS